MRSSKGLKVGVTALLAVLVLAGAGFWWFFIRDDAPPEASLVDRPAAGSSPGRSGAELDGAWAVAAGDDTFAGFRISEHFPGFDNTAVVRTEVVDGSLTVDGAEITAVDLTVDLTELESRDAQPPGVPGIENRVDQMRDDGLETERFPTATFTLTSPIVLDGRPAVGDAVTAVAEGDLTLHGETRPVAIPVEARWNGEVIDVAGSLEVALSDYGMTAPTRSFVSVDEAGTMEFQLTFVPA
jgi:polyisoprenoid-binding protein YceI